MAKYTFIFGNKGKMKFVFFFFNIKHDYSRKR